METEGVLTPTSQLPDTQNAESQCFTQSQDTLLASTAQPRVWGRLCADHKGFDTVVMTKDEYTFGRMPRCDITVKDRLPKKKENVISKTHFCVYREICITSNGLEDDVVYLKDESQNGTFVNGKLVGKGKSVVLVNNDLIAVGKSDWNVFVYMSTNGYDNSFLPEELKSKYAVSRTLGAGACGEVKLCFSKSGLTGKKYAMKIISKTKIGATGLKNPADNEKNILNEVEICKRLKHPCIIKVEEYFNTTSMLYIILELMEGGELFERIKKYNGLKEKHAKFIFYQVILAVNYLHQNGITHRDLKPENILLAGYEDETIVKVSDFGLSKIVDSQTMMKTFCGTPMYVAPEILLTGGRGSYSCQVDVWSLGVILYCCLTGLTPFKVHDKNNTLYEQIINGMYNFKVAQFLHISTAAKDLIRRMLTVDPEKRITIRSVLGHPWFNDREMLTKVNDLLGIKSNENVIPRRAVNDNIPPVAPIIKRARLD